MWVIAIDQYFKSRKLVAPIEKKLIEAQKLLDEVEQNLNLKNQNLKAIKVSFFNLGKNLGSRKILNG